MSLVLIDKSYLDDFIELYQAIDNSKFQQCWMDLVEGELSVFYPGIDGRKCYLALTRTGVVRGADVDTTDE